MEKKSIFFRISPLLLSLLSSLLLSFFCCTLLSSRTLPAPIEDLGLKARKTSDRQFTFEFLATLSGVLKSNRIQLSSWERNRYCLVSNPAHVLYLSFSFFSSNCSTIRFPLFSPFRHSPFLCFEPSTGLLVTLSLYLVLNLPKRCFLVLKFPLPTLFHPHTPSLLILPFIASNSLPATPDCLQSLTFRNCLRI